MTAFILLQIFIDSSHMTWWKCTPHLNIHSTLKDPNSVTISSSCSEPPPAHSNIASLYSATDLSNDCPHRNRRTQMGQQRPNAGPLWSGSQCYASSLLLCVCLRYTAWPGRRTCWYTLSLLIIALWIKSLETFVPVE